MSDSPRPPRVLRLWRKGRVVADVHEEFAFHLEMRTNELVAAGRSPEAARTEALQQFGDLDDATTYCRRTDQRREQRIMRTEWLTGLQQDVTFAVRTLRKAPGFTAAAVLTLAIAIGATTAVFSIVNGVLLKPLPLANPERLVRVGSVRAGNPKLTAMSYPDYADLRAQSHQVAQMSLMDNGTANLTTPGADPLRLSTVRVNANYFQVLGVQPEVGHGFSRGDDEPTANPTMVLADHLWRSRFGGDPAIVGKSVEIDGKPVTVVGVAPASVTFPRNVDAWLAWVPRPYELDPNSRGAHFLGAVGRLAPTATIAGAKSELQTIGARLSQQYPETNTQFSAGAVELREMIVGDVRPALRVMLGCVSCLLLIACANVANLLLVRAAGREPEIAVRTALGAGTVRLVRQLVTESLLLSLGGAIAGTGLAAWIITIVKSAPPRGVPRLNEVTLDGTVLLFTAATALVTGLIFGLVPALYAARSNIGSMLKGGSRGSSGGRSARRVRAVLVAMEMALAMVLLVGAGLLTRSFIQLMQVDNGFKTAHVMTASFSLPTLKYPWDRQSRVFADDLVQRMEHVPGIQSAAIVFGRPLDEQGMRITFDRDDRPPTPRGKPNTSDVRVATAGFFKTMGLHLVAGRTFTDADKAGNPLVFVVSQELARRYFPNENAIGKHITFGWTRDTSAANQDVPTTGEIVGIVGDVKQNGPAAEATPATYMSFEQIPLGELSLLVRSSNDPRLVVSAIRSQVKALDPQIPLFDIKTMDAAVSESVAQPRFYAILLGSFAAIALLLAALGIYGVIAYGVSQRTRELGIRIALGAGRGNVVRLVLRQGLVLIGAGVAAGLLASAGLTRLLSTLLFGVAPIDLPTFGAVTLVLAIVAIAATWIPAMRAAGVDPVGAMRE